MTVYSTQRGSEETHNRLEPEAVEPTRELLEKLETRTQPKVM